MNMQGLKATPHEKKLKMHNVAHNLNDYSDPLALSGTVVNNMLN